MKKPKIATETLKQVKITVFDSRRYPPKKRNPQGSAHAEVYLSPTTVEFFSFDEAYLRRLEQRDPETEKHFVQYFTAILVSKLRTRSLHTQDVDELKQEIDAARAMPKFQPIIIKPEASPSDIAFIESHRGDIPVLEMLMVRLHLNSPDASDVRRMAPNAPDFQIYHLREGWKSAARRIKEIAENKKEKRRAPRRKVVVAF